MAKPIQLKVSDTILQSPIDVAQALNQHFVASVASVAQSFQVQQNNVCSPTNTNKPALALRPVSKTEVAKIIASLKSSKAKDVCGMDTLKLRQISSSISKPLTRH